MARDRLDVLRAEWYERLRESGFEDIEWGAASGTFSPYLKGRNCVSLCRGYQYGIDEYYRLAGWYLHDNQEWPTEEERQIWVWHASGDRGNEIALRLKRSKNFVRAVLARHRARMKQLYVEER